MLPKSVLVTFALGLAGLADAAPTIMARQADTDSNTGSGAASDGEMHILPYPYLGEDSNIPPPQKRQSVLDTLGSMSPEELERASLATETVGSDVPAPVKRQSLADLTPEEAERLWRMGAVAGTEGIPPEMQPTRRSPQVYWSERPPAGPWDAPIDKRQTLGDLTPEQIEHIVAQASIAGTEGLNPPVAEKRQEGAGLPVIPADVLEAANRFNSPSALFNTPEKRQDGLSGISPEAAERARIIAETTSSFVPVERRQLEDVLPVGPEDKERIDAIIAASGASPIRPQ